MTASNYPMLLDTDVQLLRRVASDAIVPADHNNLVDAVEQIEPTVGPVDDGTGPLGAPAFNCALAQYTNFMTVGMGNVRFPYYPLPANAWYGVTGSKPATWTAGVNPVFDWLRHPGLCRVHVPLGITGLQLSANIVGSSPWDLVFALRMAGHVSSPTQIWCFGFSHNGLGTDLDGVYLYSLSPLSVGWRACANNIDVSPAIYPSSYGPAGKLWLHNNGADIQIYGSVDGLAWVHYGAPFAVTGTPTKICFTITASATQDNDLLIDFISQGNANPPNA